MTAFRPPRLGSGVTLGGGQIKTAWIAMCRRAGITDFTPHDGRHTWATWHHPANRDFRVLMERVGWKSPDLVLRYAHVNTEHLAPSIDKLWNEGRTERVGSVPKQGARFRRAPG